MIFKLIIFALIGIGIYKLFGGSLPSLSRDKKDKMPKGDDSKKIEEDTLVECVKCGTYVTYKESIIVKGEIYCSRECASL
ncbi:hypothetical protein MNB_SV-6-1340 [hydrothermal vent metagenome]|uniref:Prokaryotic metallothionein n=1 Tax=hydrothermal vent metagenome TaxID=652676 RepID=A0A1W1BF10_9ZZZZ